MGKAFSRKEIRQLMLTKPVTTGWLTLCAMGIIVAVFIIEVAPR